MATRKLFPDYIADPANAALVIDSAAVGNGDSDIVDFGTAQYQCVLTSLSAIGATPTVTLNIQGSMDGSTWYNVDYSVPATPATLSQAAITTTTATTKTYFIKRTTSVWRYLKVVRSANTNVTLTHTLYPLLMAA